MKFSKERRAFELTRGRVHGKIPAWRASKKCISSVEALLRALKVPRGWPSLPESLDSITTLKLDQTLAFAGHVGRYLLETLDISPDFQTHMQAYLRALQDCQQKRPVIPIHDIMGRLQEAGAALESALPAYWNTITKHYGAAHLDRFQILWGCFQYTSELVHERMMCKMKRLCHNGKRDRMITFMKNWDTFQTANGWLLEKHLALTYQAIHIHLDVIFPFQFGYLLVTSPQSITVLFYRPLLRQLLRQPRLTRGEVTQNSGPCPNTRGSARRTSPWYNRLGRCEMNCSTLSSTNTKRQWRGSSPERECRLSTGIFLLPRSELGISKRTKLRRL